MDWIFDNLYLVIIILFGIISFLSSSGKKEEEQKKKQSTPPNNPTQTRQRQQQSSSQGAGTQQQSQVQRQRQREQPRAQRQVYQEGERPDISAGSIEEQQQKQMERMADRYQTSSQEDLEDAEQNFKGLKVERKSEENAPGRAEMKRRVSGNLEGKGLVNGIIMAEVLGSPRAKKPYRSIIQKRK
ncbi:hypothetical protein [Oceanobacillus locisalsi]|uniref:Uncharacterized protein n=1 Tax=Oceanobacillus locisalsi TaxID=546107 RepID=A0ABW3NHL6_9BACI